MDAAFDSEADEVPTETPRETRRWVPSARLTAIVIALLGACAGLWWWSATVNPPEVRPVDVPDAMSPDTGGGSPSPQTTRMHDGGQALVVHVAGAVAHPGVFTLPSGSRVHEAIAAAGGATAEADQNRLNLASPIEDGVRIIVPRMDEPLEGPGGSNPSGNASQAAASGSKSGKVNLNTAAAEELSTLPRVGQVLAQRIVQYRTQHGRFTSVDGLDAVPGIGPAMLESLRPLVTV